ncbi:hypothetical protein [Vibrio phage vB_VmeM-Yong XC32]|nr:hypothetical protein [Vibrio phage vB_VmeM-Yong XC31]QAX96455.1 hypothetical protein [Vibrio phage vB_VmeM-Yong XC32]QAX96772.1 hypothetical protein [Vibrio phage vB_VmeM-Yong MS31]QAX97091.1 hypothetical protein [Vibrio phage vB_VmeM-Yong MS32]
MENRIPEDVRVELWKRMHAFSAMANGVRRFEAIQYMKTLGKIRVDAQAWAIETFHGMGLDVKSILARYPTLELSKLQNMKTKSTRFTACPKCDHGLVVRFNGVHTVGLSETEWCCVSHRDCMCLNCKEIFPWSDRKSYRVDSLPNHLAHTKTALICLAL